MNIAFEHLRTTRENFLALTHNLSLKELNTIPANFNNNLIWQLGHVLVTQQLLTYGLSGLPLQVSDSLVGRYKKGSTPTGDATEEEWGLIQRLLIELPEQTLKDYAAGIFKEFKAYDTSFRIRLNTLEEALTFVNIHEGLHMGYVMAQRRAVATT